MILPLLVAFLIAGQQQAPTYEKTVCPQGKPCVTTPQTGKPPFTCDVTGGCNYCKAVEVGSDCVHVPYGGKGDPNDTTRAIAGQQPCAGGAPPKNAPDCIPVQAFIQKSGTLPAGPERLKCGKYQHVDHWPGQCGPAPCDDKTGGCLSVCAPAPPDRCADDLHTVTEREWQELMEHIRWFDHIRKEQCPSLSWINGRCIPSCKDDPNGSCKPDPPKEQRK